MEVVLTASSAFASSASVKAEGAVELVAWVDWYTAAIAA